MGELKLICITAHSINISHNIYISFNIRLWGSNVFVQKADFRFNIQILTFSGLPVHIWHFLAKCYLSIYLLLKACHYQSNKYNLTPFWVPPPPPPVSSFLTNDPHVILHPCRPGANAISIKVKCINLE